MISHGQAKGWAVDLPHGDLVDATLIAYDQYWTALRQTTEPVWAQLDLTCSQLKCLILLEVRGSMTIGQVGEVLAIGRPSSSTLVEQLVQRGLVERTEDQSDRRRTLVSLSAEGLTLAARLHKGDVEYMHTWFERIDDASLAALCTGLRALAAAIGKSL